MKKYMELKFSDFSQIMNYILENFQDSKKTNN